MTPKDSALVADLRNARMMVNRGNGDVRDEPDTLHEEAASRIEALTTGPSRYCVFVGAEYYPAGGFDDFVDSFDVESHAEDFGKWLSSGSKYRWFNVTDLQSVTPVAKEDWWY